MNEDLCSLINDYVQLEGNVKSVYKLASSSELSDDVDVPAAPTAPVFPPELPKGKCLCSSKIMMTINCLVLM